MVLGGIKRFWAGEFMVLGLLGGGCFCLAAVCVCVWVGVGVGVVGCEPIWQLEFSHLSWHKIAREMHETCLKNP